jgi:hypothetical protein
MGRAEASGISLSAKDAAVVKAMLNRGDRQHDIAAWFGVNGGRVADIATGKRHAKVVAATHGLPPSGPYLAGREAHAAMFALEEAARTINAALALIKERAELSVRSPALSPEPEMAQDRV